MMELQVDHPVSSIGQVLLMEALGTKDEDFYNGLLGQLANAGTQGRKVDARGLNFMLSVARGIEPEDHFSTASGIWTKRSSASTGTLHQHRGERHEHRASRLPKREAMAIGFNGIALDRGSDAGSSQRLPPTEGAQTTSSVTCRSGSTSHASLNSRRPCSPSRRRVTSTTATTASQCSTKSDLDDVEQTVIIPPQPPQVRR
jgi:hypothetical protein